MESLRKFIIVAFFSAVTGATQAQALSPECELQIQQDIDDRFKKYKHYLFALPYLNYKADELTGACKGQNPDEYNIYDFNKSFERIVPEMLKRMKIPQEPKGPAATV